MQPINYGGVNKATEMMARSYLSNLNMPLQMSSKFLDQERNVQFKEQKVVGKRIKNDNIGVNVARGIKENDSAIMNRLEAGYPREQETRIKRSNDNKADTKKSARTTNSHSKTKVSPLRTPFDKNKNISPKVDKNQKSMSGAMRGLIKSKSQKLNTESGKNSQEQVGSNIKNQPANKNDNTTNSQTVNSIMKQFSSQKQKQAQILNSIRSGQNIILLTKQKTRKTNSKIQNSSQESQQTINNGSDYVKLFENTHTSEENKQKAVDDKQPLKSIFSPNIKQKQHNQGLQQLQSAQKRIGSQDKENQQSLTNKKNQPSKPLSNKNLIKTSVDIISTDLIQKLKNEVQKQVKKISEQESQKQLSSPKKHKASIISYEVRQQLRQKKLKQQQDAQKQQQEINDHLKQKAELKSLQHQQMREIHQNTQMIRKSLQISPLKKLVLNQNKISQKYKAEHDQAHHQQDTDTIIQPQRPMSSQYMTETEKYLKNNLKQGEAQDNDDNKRKGMLQLKDYLKDIKAQKNKNMPCQVTNKQQSGEKNQKLNEFLKKQKIKRLNDNQVQVMQEQQKEIRKQQQLNSLNQLQKIQIDQFKQKQRSQSDKRVVSKSKSKKKKKMHSASSKNLKINTLQQDKNIPRYFGSPLRQSQKSLRRSNDLLQSPQIYFQTNNNLMLRNSNMQIIDQQSSQIDPLSSNMLSRGSMDSINMVYQSLQQLPSSQFIPNQQNKANDYNDLPVQPNTMPSKKKVKIIKSKSSRGAPQRDNYMDNGNQSENKFAKLFNEFQQMRKDLEDNIKQPKKQKQIIKLKKSASEKNQQSKHQQQLSKNRDMPLRDSKNVKYIERIIHENVRGEQNQLRQSQKQAESQKDSQNKQGIYKIDEKSIKQIGDHILNKFKEIHQAQQQNIQNQSSNNKDNESQRQLSFIPGDSEMFNQNFEQRQESPSDIYQTNRSLVVQNRNTEQSPPIINLQKIECDSSIRSPLKQGKAAELIQKYVRGYLGRQKAINELLIQNKDALELEETQQINDSQIQREPQIRDNQVANIIQNDMIQSVVSCDIKDYQESLMSISSPFNQQMLQNEFYRPSDQDARLQQQFSILKTPSIHQNESASMIDSISKNDLNQQPLKLFSLQNQNEEQKSNIKVFSPTQHVNNSNQSYSNESQNSIRSKFPLHQESPFVYETKLSSINKHDYDDYVKTSPMQQLKDTSTHTEQQLQSELNLNIQQLDQNSEPLLHHVMPQKGFEENKKDKSNSRIMPVEQIKDITSQLHMSAQNYNNSFEAIPQNKMSSYSIINNSEFVIKDSIIDENQLDINQKARKLSSHQHSLRDDSFVSSQTNMSIFEKNSFQNFSKDKITKVFKAEKQIESMIKELNKALNNKIQYKKEKLNQQNYTTRTYDRKKIKLDRWVEKEQEEIITTQKHFSKGVNKLSSILENFVKDQGRIKEAVKQIRKSSGGSIQSMSIDNTFQDNYSKGQSKEDNQSPHKISDIVLESLEASKNKILGQGEESILSVHVQEEEEDLIQVEGKDKKQIFDYQKSDQANIDQDQNIFEPLNPLYNTENTRGLTIDDQDNEEQYIQINAKNVIESNIGSHQKEREVIVETKQDDEESPNNIISFALNNDDKKQSAINIINPLLSYEEPSKSIIIQEQPNDQDNIKSMEEFNYTQNDAVADKLVEEILNNILLKEIDQRLFPQRVVVPKTTANENQDSIQQDDNMDISNKLSNHSIVDDALEYKKKQGIQTNLSQVRVYMEEVFEKIIQDKDSLNIVLDNVSQPLYKDPLQILAHLQNSYLETNENQVIPYQQSVLSVDLYLDIEKDRRGMSISKMKDSFEESNTQSFIAEMENIHNKAIFDAINEALDGFRPYGLKGPPLPWSRQSKTLTFKFGKEETVDYLLQKVKFRLLDWGNMNAGMVGFDGMDDRDKHQLEMMREDRLARILIQEAEENEPLWTDYEYEETQTKLDLADLIVSQLCGETVTLLQDLQLKKIEDQLIVQQQQQNEQLNQ